MKNIIFMIILSVFLSVSIYADNCVSEIYNNKEIKYCNDLTDWKGAQANCRMMNMTLLTDYDISIDTHLYEALMNMNTGLNFWIGLNDVETEGVFVWDSGLTSDYRVWAEGQPNNTDDKDCVFMAANSEYYWVNSNCFTPNAYICEGIVADLDNDGVLDESDNCPNIANQDQLNSDDDEFGDTCDLDDDNDSIPDEIDNCTFVANPDQKDVDSDNIGDICDNCQVTGNTDQINTDKNSVLLTEFARFGSEQEELEDSLNMANDSFGNIYVSDMIHSKVNKYDKFGNYIMSVLINSPIGISITPNNDIYISNVLNQVGKFNTDGELTAEFSVVLDNNRVIINLHVTETNIYFLSIDRAHNQNVILHKYDLTGTFITQWEIPSVECIGIATDSENNIYVADDIHNKIFVYNTEGVLLNTLTGNGKLSLPIGIKISDNQEIYIVNYGNNSVEKFDLNGNHLETIINTNLNMPTALALFNNNIYILTQSELRIKKYNMGDTLGDACDDDKDNDGILNSGDNCELIYNVDQLNTDEDELGNSCDDDIDNDTVLNIDDNCIYIQNETQVDIDEDLIGDNCDDNYCSSAQPEGQCAVGKLCDNGQCVNYVYDCSPLHTDGICFDGKECVEGVCTDIYYECSATHTDGYCEEGKVCDNGVCINAIYACSSKHTDGYCESGYECIDGSCVKVDTVNACSPAHLDGLCQSGYECKEGVCVILSDNNNSSGSADSCSFSGFIQKSGEHTDSPLHGTAEGIMLFIMVIGLYISRKYLKTK